MPVMTGLELVREIRRNPPAGPALKVIVYSACLGADDAGCYRRIAGGSPRGETLSPARPGRRGSGGAESRMAIKNA